MIMSTVAHTISVKFDDKWYPDNYFWCDIRFDGKDIFFWVSEAYIIQYRLLLVSSRNSDITLPSNTNDQLVIIIHRSYLIW